jgi:general secretion pathway protein L
MPTWLGIDIGTTSVKAALVRSAYRKLALARLASSDVSSPGGTAAAVRAAVSAAMEGEAQGADAIAVSVEGSRVAVHRLTLPGTAQKQLAEVLTYELEAQVPFDLEGAVFDWRLLGREGEGGPLSIVAAVARV